MAGQVQNADFLLLITYWDGVCTYKLVTQFCYGLLFFLYMHQLNKAQFHGGYCTFCVTSYLPPLTRFPLSLSLFPFLSLFPTLTLLQSQPFSSLSLAQSRADKCSKTSSRNCFADVKAQRLWICDLSDALSLADLLKFSLKRWLPRPRVCCCCGCARC